MGSVTNVGGRMGHAIGDINSLEAYAIADWRIVVADLLNDPFLLTYLLTVSYSVLNLVSNVRSYIFSQQGKKKHETKILIHTFPR